MKASDFADLAALKERWDIERSTWFEYVDGLSVGSLNQGYGTDPENRPKVWQTIMHVVVHGIQHRSEADCCFDGLWSFAGRELDFGVFLHEKRENREN